MLVTREMSHRYLCHKSEFQKIFQIITCQSCSMLLPKELKKKKHLVHKTVTLCSLKEVMISSLTSNLLEKLIPGSEIATCHRNLIYNFTTNCQRMVVRIHNFHFGFMSSRPSDEA